MSAVPVYPPQEYVEAADHPMVVRIEELRYVGRELHRVLAAPVDAGEWELVIVDAGNVYSFGSRPVDLQIDVEGGRWALVPDDKVVAYVDPTAGQIYPRLLSPDGGGR